MIIQSSSSGAKKDSFKLFIRAMENAKKTYTYQAIQDVLELLERVNGMIELHRSQKTPDTLAIAGYERQREQFVTQLAELLSQFEVQIVRPPDAA